MDIHFMMCVSQIIIQYCMSVISQYNLNKNTLKKICQCLCPIDPGLVAKGFVNPLMGWQQFIRRWLISWKLIISVQ